MVCIKQYTEQTEWKFNILMPGEVSKVLFAKMPILTITTDYLNRQTLTTIHLHCPTEVMIHVNIDRLPHDSWNNS